MRVYSSEYVFDAPWEEVVKAAWKKYPNPMNQAVSSIDVLNHEITKQGSLISERILESEFHVPSWVTKLTGFAGTQYSHETSEIHPEQQIMSLYTRNLNCIHFLRVDEKMSYQPHPTDMNKTVLRQEASVQVRTPAFSDYCEKAFLSVYQANAEKGRKGLEWVIDKLKKEYNEVSTRVTNEVSEISDKIKHALGTSTDDSK
ncbi:hypothetical protein QR680_009684 [Steinernema hermaphroditum]|uniref:PRELI/MSF1 domain-containing protein n=1 Tax=Steinernema hermaphroditum TaxID=289476 RepID=A0AA39IN85_9BILA|nr:hypothetical protein QR680_009684 [Steinernema hermaphroditum]